MKKEPIVAVNVVILGKDKKVLIAKRPVDKPMPNKWEFPGGKLELGESLEECAIREIQEELEVDINISKYVGFENISYENQDFCLHLYTATMKDISQELTMNEHTELVWVRFEEFINFDFPASKLSFMKNLKIILDEEME